MGAPICPASLPQSLSIYPDTEHTMEHWFSSPGPEEEARKRAELLQLFTTADTNKDGKLTPEEWWNLLNRTGIQATREEVDKCFSSMDRDFDGRLSFAEIMGEETPIEKLFKLMDKNGDGFVSKKEFMTICRKLSKEQVRVAFHKFDLSGDDRLDYREFCEMIRRQKEEEREGD